jgi:hypothetical protein
MAGQLCSVVCMHQMLGPVALVLQAQGPQGEGQCRARHCADDGQREPVSALCCATGGSCHAPNPQGLRGSHGRRQGNWAPSRSDVAWAWACSTCQEAAVACCAAVGHDAVCQLLVAPGTHLSWQPLIQREGSCHCSAWLSTDLRSLAGLGRSVSPVCCHGWRLHSGSSGGAPRVFLSTPAFPLCMRMLRGGVGGHALWCPPPSYHVTAVTRWCGVCMGRRAVGCSSSAVQGLVLASLSAGALLWCCKHGRAELSRVPHGVLKMPGRADAHGGCNPCSLSHQTSIQHQTGLCA